MNLKILIAVLVTGELNLVICEPISEISCDFNQNAINQTICDYGKFDVELDNWRLIPSSRLRESSVTDGPLRGPPNSINGNFLQLRQSTNSSVGHIASPPVEMFGDHCLELDYYLFTTGFNSKLLIYARSKSSQYVDITLFARNEISNYVDKWRHYRRTIKFGIDDFYRIFIFAESYDNYLNGSSVAIDNLSFTRGPCSNVDLKPDLQTCQFDGMFGDLIGGVNCDWIKIKPDSTPFEVNSNQKGFDPNLGFPRIPHSVVKLSLPRFNVEDGIHCLSFWVLDAIFVSGNYKVQELGLLTNVSNTLLHSEPGSSNNQDWRRHFVEIDPVVALEVSLIIDRRPFNLDSMELRKGKCPKPLNCDFRDNLCNWRRLGDIPIRIGYGRIADEQLAPLRMPAYGHRFLYIDFSRIAKHDSRTGIAILVSELFSSSTPSCLKFDFQRFQNVTIEVEMVFENDEIDPIPLEPNHIQQTSNWQQVLIDINKSSLPYRIAIKISGHRSSMFRLKDLVLEDGSCRNLLNLRQANLNIVFPEVNYHCYHTGHRIAQFKACDGVIDCPMGEDEGPQCDLHKCNITGLPCKIRGHAHCLRDLALVCNGIQNCDDGIDEDPRLCRQSQPCDNYCLNDAICHSFCAVSGCDCLEGFSGKRCQHEHKMF